MSSEKKIINKHISEAQMCISTWRSLRPKFLGQSSPYPKRTC